MLRRTRCFLPLLVVISASSIQAGIIYSNLGSPETYNPGSWALNLSEEALAAPFTNSVAAQLGFVRVPVQNFVPGNLYFLQVADDNSGLPGTVLESFGSLTFPADGLVTVTSLSHPNLSPGAVYWVVVGIEANSQDPRGGWHMQAGATGPVVGDFAYNSGGTWNQVTNYFPAFRVDSLDTVPEPGTVGLTLLGGLALLVSFRKRSAR